MIRLSFCLSFVFLVGCATAQEVHLARKMPEFRSYFEVDGNQVHYMVQNTDEAPIEVQMHSSGTYTMIINFYGGLEPSMAFAPCMGSNHEKPTRLEKGGVYRHTIKLEKHQPNSAVDYIVHFKVNGISQNDEVRFNGSDFRKLEKKMQDYYKKK